MRSRVTSVNETVNNDNQTLDNKEAASPPIIKEREFIPAEHHLVKTDVFGYPVKNRCLKYKNG